MESFSQFSSDLDEVTQKMLLRGQKLTILLKQDQYVPLAVEEQVVMIYAGVKGYLDTINVKDVQCFEKELLLFMHQKDKYDLLQSIAKEKKITEEAERNLKDTLAGFVKHFAQ